MTPFDQPILVTRPYLPPIERVHALLDEVWHNHWLTNRGPLLARFQQTLAGLFGIDTNQMALFANGTLAMDLTLRTMGLPPGGRVITTPFTFVATGSAIVNAGLEPVFVETRPEDATLDPQAVEAAIDERTVAIAPVHVFGMPCQLDALQDIADRHNLRLLYDAAHCTGVSVNGQSIGAFGHASMFSLHATKLFHAVECGVITSPDPDLIRRLSRLKNFGYDGPVRIVPGGTNAKISEVHAAVGLACCEDFHAILQRRREQATRYRRNLADTPGIDLFPLPGPEVEYNYSYMPILVDPEQYGCDSDQLEQRLKELNVFTRRYFFPLLNDVEAFAHCPVRGELPVARHIADRVLCLPVYHELTMDAVDRICEMVIQRQQSA